MMSPAPMGEKLVKALNVRVLGDEASETTLVLAHGFGCNQSVWDAALPALLREGLRVVLFDWPGAPSTQLTPPPAFYHPFAHILLHLLQHLNVSSCVFVGHSMSAMIGCIAALLQPAIFRKLILVGASPRYLNSQDYYGGFEQEELEQLYAAMAADFGRWATAFSLDVVGTEAAAEAVRQFEVTLSSMQPDVAQAMAKAIFESDFRGVVDDLIDRLLSNQTVGNAMEVIVLQTRKDVAVPLAVSDYLKRHLGKKATVKILEVDGHLPHLSAPHCFTSALLHHILVD